MVSIFPEMKAFADHTPDSEAALTVRNLTKSFGAERVLDGVSFTVAEGESLVLLGHSGSGKSTTLRLIAGLEQPDGGEIFLHGRSVERLRARDRNVGVIFQNYALFPRMTVAENIGFGLRIRGVKSHKRAEITDRMLVLIGLAEHRDKYPWQISGGQQQRVAIARALAYEPDVLLFDESFSALDPQTRVGLRRDIRALLRRLRVPALFITHDQEEAMDLGDHIAILNGGRLEQTGTPDQVYNEPKTEFVATFLGAANVVAATAHTGSIELDPERLLPIRYNSVIPGPVKVVFRPEDVVLSTPASTPETPYPLGRGEIVDVSFTGASEAVMVRLTGKGELSSISEARSQFQTGSLQRSSARSGIVIKALRTKWDARHFGLHPGDAVSVGLRHFSVLVD